MNDHVFGAALAVALLAQASAAIASEAERSSPPGAAHFIAKAEALQLSASRPWRLLLHYRDAMFGQESQADGAGFFFASDGKRDPAAELQANIEAFLAPAQVSTADDLPQCRFPARYRWLDAQLGFEAAGYPTVRCPRYEAWWQVMKPAGITLVFASSFINAPASMYGHTLLRVDRSDAGGNLLLSNIINFGARTNTNNPLLYAMMGLFGGFVGRFTAIPYYMKVQEYSNFESRDLWEYQLNFTAAEIDRLLQHTWEMDQTYFDYYYLSENCSYHLLALLEVAAPRFDLTSRFGAWAIPTDTLRAVLDQPGLVRARSYRPSHTAQMQVRRAALSDDEADLARALAEEEAPDPALLQPLPLARQAAVLDAAHDFLKAENGYTLNVDTDETRRVRKRELLLLRARSKVSVTTGPPLVEEPPAAETGHDTSRLALAAGAAWLGDKATPYGELAYRTSLHDLLDRQSGFSPDSQIEMSQLRLRLHPERLNDPQQRLQALQLERFDLINIFSVQPLTDWIRMPSWRVAMSAGRVRDLGCADWRCTAVDAYFGRGLAFGSHWLGRQTFYLFADLLGSAGPAFKPNYRIGVDVAGGLLLQFGERWRLHGEARYRYDLLGDYRAGRQVLGLALGQSIAVQRNFALRMQLYQDRGFREGTFEAHLFF